MCAVCGWLYSCGVDATQKTTCATHLHHGILAAGGGHASRKRPLVSLEVGVVSCGVSVALGWALCRLLRGASRRTLGWVWVVALGAVVVAVRQREVAAEVAAFEWEGVLELATSDRTSAGDVPVHVATITELDVNNRMRGGCPADAIHRNPTYDQGVWMAPPPHPLRLALKHTS